MTPTRLANENPETAWANHAWPEFRELDGRASAILPVFAYADHGIGAPLDSEEIVGSALLKEAVAALPQEVTCRVLPPLRFALAPYPHSFFGLDAETAQEIIREIAESVKAAGFRKLVFFNASPWNVELVDAASRDARVALSLQTFIVNLNGLNLDFHPTSDRRAHVQAVVSHLLGRPAKASSRTADIGDAAFRPGRFCQPAPQVPNDSLDGAALFAQACSHLGQLLREIDARPALGAPLAAPTVQGTTISSSRLQLGVTTHWPDYRPRYLMAFTREELDAVPDKDRALIIVPTGAIEQHGPHLPVGVDALLGQAWLNATLPKLSIDAPVFVAPPLTYGKSNEHVGFPGTVFISARSLRRILLAVATQLKALGFRQIAILNTHGGNSAVIVYTLREIQMTLGLRAGLLSQPYKPELSPQEQEYGFHAGEWETALMLAAAQNLVNLEKAVSEFPARLEDPGELRPENAPATFSWISSDISKSGVMGDAPRATFRNGKQWLDAGSTALAQSIAHLLRRDHSGKGESGLERRTAQPAI